MRAKKIIANNPLKLGNPKQNDPKRFIKTISLTDNGEIADNTRYFINEAVIEQESVYDGLYAICTNLEDGVADIIKANHRRWEIEKSFRIMKSEFNARPVFHSNEDAIKAHFLICFLALTIYRYLDKKVKNTYTIHELLDTLRSINLRSGSFDSYIPNYIRTYLTDDLHSEFGFRTNFEAIKEKNLKNICKNMKIK